MTCLTTLADERDLNYKLARTIGYVPGKIHMPCNTYDVFVLFNRKLEKFDYKDWRTISPIAEKYDLFPALSGFFPGDWVCTGEYRYYAKTPQLAIALAVVEEYYGLS